ncbi:hypothetical protein DFH09DRAFT_1441204 [Mycena vulgaris]|nr:hypothetical protein DFH09DRAFT_1441204 [Mycena vulgaris]
MKDFKDWKELTSNWIHHKGSPGDRTASKKAKSTTESVVDNLSVAVDIAEKVAEILQVAPVIAPVGALLGQILEVYQDMKSTREKRDVLAATITALSGDICATVLRMEGTKCSDLMVRLKADLEKYAALISRASELVDKYDKQGKILRFASRKPLAGEIDEINEELTKVGERFRSNRLVDLAINLSSNTDTLNHVYDMVNKKKLEEWLLFPPKMTEKHNNTEKRRKDGTGRWFLEGKEFIEWQDNPGVLWIEGHSGAGKSVLCSAVISKLDDDKSLAKELESPRPAPALAYFYFDFNNTETQDVEIALRRIILQLSDQCPDPYKSLDEHYAGRQTLPSYKDLQQKILPVLLRELGRTYIVLDGLDECDNYDGLVDLISTFRQWNETLLHVFITSQSRRVFTESFDGVMRVALKYSVTEADIRFFVRDEIQSKSEYESWRLHVDRITDQIASRSNGMFRLADCLLLEISRCMSTTELDEALKNLPDTLFKVYNRFLDKVSPTHLVYVMAALRWILFAAGQITLDQLADALSFDFSNPDEYSYDPERRERNKLAIFRWLEGLVVKSTTYDGIPMAVLAHSSVKEYALSDHFSTRFGCNLEKNHSYSFIARTCISYFLSVGDHSMPAEPASNLAKYAAKHWIHHLVLCEDPPALFTQAMRVLAEGSGPYRAFCSSSKSRRFLEYSTPSPLHICCQDGYIEGVEALLATGVDINLAPAEYPRATALTFASNSGHTDIVDLLLRNQADPNIPSDYYGCALAAASENGHIEVVRLLLKSGANANLPDGEGGSPLAAASVRGHIEILRLLLESGADINQPIPATVWDSHGSALGVACSTWSEQPEVVHFLLDNGADINLPGGEYGSPLGSACWAGRIGIVRLLLQRGADTKILGGMAGGALSIACGRDQTEIVRLLLQNGADIDAAGGYAGSPLGCASFHGQTAVVRLLIDSGANVNMPGGFCGSPLGYACYGIQSDTARLLLDNGADINLPAGDYGSVLGAAASSTDGTIDDRLETLRLLLERGAGVQKHMDHALKLALNLDLKMYEDFGGDERLEQEGYRSQVVQFLRERGAVANSELEGETASEESNFERVTSGYEKKRVVCYHGPPRTIRGTPRAVHAPHPRLRVPSSRARRVRGLGASPRALATPPAPPFPLVPVPPSAAYASSAARARGVGAAPRHARRNAGTALLVLAPPPPCALTPRVRPVHHIPASTGTAHPRARDTFLPRWLRTHTPERRARGSLTTSTAASPRVRGLGASPRALGAALLLALAPRTPRARRPPREREGSVQRPVVLASFALSPRSPSYLHPIRAPRSPNPREYVSPRAHLHGICRLPAPRTPPSPHPREYGDTMPPCARSPHRPCRTAPRTCTPVRAQGVAAALSSSHLHRPSARARGADFVPDSPTAIPRTGAGVVRAQPRCTGMTRAASLRSCRGGHGTLRSAADHVRVHSPRGCSTLDSGGEGEGSGVLR